LEISVLSEQCYLLMPSLSRIIQNLELREMVSRRISDEDQRRSIITLTSQGIETVKTISPKSEERYAHITDAFGYGKLELLYELLDELVEKLDEEDSQK